MNTKISSITITVGAERNISVLQSEGIDTIRSVFVNGNVHFYGEESHIRALCTSILVALDNFTPDTKDSTND